MNHMNTVEGLNLLQILLSKPGQIYFINKNNLTFTKICEALPKVVPLRRLSNQHTLLKTLIVITKIKRNKAN